MLRRLRNTLIVAMSIFMLLGIKEVSYAKEDGVASSVTSKTTDETSSTDSAITSVYEERLDALLTETGMKLSKKYSNLIVICYCQISEWYVNGELTEEQYLIAREPFVEDINNLLTASDKEILNGYKSTLAYLYDTMTEDEVAGYEIDQDLYDFVMDEIDAYDVEL